MENVITFTMDYFLKAYSSLNIDNAEEKPFKTNNMLKLNTIEDTTWYINKATSYIKNNWNSFDNKQKELLETFCYSYIGEIDKVKIKSKVSYIKLLKNFISTFRLILSGNINIISEYFVAMEDLKNAILNAVENENPVYKKDISEAVENAIKNENCRITSGEFDERLRRI